MKIVLNKCYGGFGLSPKAIKRYLELKSKECFFYKQTKYEFRNGVEEHTKVENPENNMFIGAYTKDFGDTFEKYPGNEFFFSTYDIERTDPDLVKVVEELGEEASGQLSKLEIVEIPDDIKWEIDDYDGIETVEEEHRSW